MGTAVMPPEESFVIAMPVPNITGDLHIGHALNLVLQDAVARYVRQQGRQVSFRPGVDHAGVNGQMAAERALAASGTDRLTLGRPAFDAYMRSWHDEHQAKLLGAMKDLAISADWEDAVSSVDQERTRLVQSAFAAMIEEGIVYRDLCLVSWCTRCSTCIPNEEVGRHEVTHTAYHLRLGGGSSREHVLITLDPLLMFAASGVRMPPSYDSLGEGEEVRLPGTDRVVAVERALTHRERALGGGLSLVLPSYNADDFEAARVRGETVSSLFNPDGTMCLPGHHYDGWPAAAARSQLVAELECGGDILHTEPYLHGEAYHEPCGALVIPRPTMQWLIRLDALSKIAASLAAHPPTRFNAPMWKERVDKVLDGVEHGGKPSNPWWEGACLAFVQGFSSNRDWMISRQNWWGIPIPVLECSSCGFWQVSLRARPTRCVACGDAMQATEDVFDVLFHSALWAYCVAPNLEAAYHADLAVIGHDILEFWIPVANLLSEAVFERPSIAAVLVHGLICDDSGKKMSKSQGNALNLTELLETHGAEAVRALVLGLRDSATSELVPLRPPDIVAAVAFVQRLESWLHEVYVAEPVGPSPIAEALEGTREVLAARMRELDVPGGYEAVRAAADIAVQQDTASPSELTALRALLSPFHPLLAAAIDERWAAMTHVAGGPT